MHESEAERIYKTIFGTKVPQSIQKHFDTLSKRIDSLFSDEEIAKYNECILRTHDLEALELAARYLKRLPILTLKFKIMVYLGETLAENYTHYINEKDNFFMGSLLLVFSLVRTSYKFVKGLSLLAINRL